MTGDRNAPSDVMEASENGFLDGFSHENYINYWSDILYQHDLSFSIGGYADYAFLAGAGISAEVEFSVSNGWGGNINFNSNLGYGASAGFYIVASVATPLATTPGNLSGSTGFDIKGPFGGGVSVGGGRVGGNISAGWGTFSGVNISTPLF